MQDNRILLEIKRLNIEGPSGLLVKNISFKVQQGKCLAFVGESGSGKSIIALTIMGLLPGNLKVKDLKAIDGIIGIKRAMIFQEPMSALNPTMRVGDQITEGAISALKISKRRAIEKAIDWIDKVKIKDPRKSYGKYPHQLSGGERQRVMIAMAMVMEPQLLIADEPTTALDNEVAVEILSLLRDLQAENKMALIFISHDIESVAQIADTIMVIQHGNEVESGESNDVLLSPTMP